MKKKKRVAFRKDFVRMEAIIKEANLLNLLSETNSFLPEVAIVTDAPVEDKILCKQQIALSHILETATGFYEARALLNQSILVNTSWNREAWEPYVLGKAIAIAQKWKNGFV